MVAFCRIDVCIVATGCNIRLFNELRCYRITVISYLLIPIGLKYLKTTLVDIYGYLILIVATITSLLIGQDRFSWTQTFAIICICAGVYLVEIAEGKEKKTVKV